MEAKNNLKSFDAAWLLSIPSFWGALGWWAAFLLYHVPLLDWYQGSNFSKLVLVITGIAFVASTSLFAKQFRQAVATRDPGRLPVGSAISRTFLHAIGLLGCAFFIYQIETAGVLSDSFANVVVVDPLEIRGTSFEGYEWGIRISYVGWLASFMSGASMSRATRFRKYDIAFVLLQMLANLVFLSKVRPIVVLLLVFLGVAICGRFQWSARKTLSISMVLIVTVCTFFVVWSNATKKQFTYGLGLPPSIETLLMYVSSGPAYLSFVIDHETPTFEAPYQSANGFYRAASVVTGQDYPKKNIEFYAVPHLTNVGTAIVPFYRDYGVPGVLVGIIIISFAVDWLALIAIRVGGIGGYLMAAILCFDSLSAFFAERLASTPTMLGLIALGVSAGLRLMGVSKLTLIPKIKVVGNG